MKRIRRAAALVAATGLAFGLVGGWLLAMQSRAAAAPLAPEAVTAVQYATGLSGPVDITHTGLPTDTRLFVVERAGRIRVIQSNGVTGTVLATPFLVITNIVNSTSNPEMGLLGLAFSPQYATNGHFFVYYNDLAGDLVLARYSVSADPNVAAETGTVILPIAHPIYGNHNGGDLAFGPDGFLYLAPGDGGHTPEKAQDTSSLLGKVLRLNVTGVPTYTVPTTNPFTAGGGLAEIWALGLRNPFRFSFDRETGDFYLGDVGQNAWEEVNFRAADDPAGANFGWSCYEGSHPFPTTGCEDASHYVMPVAEYCNEGQGASCVNGGRAVIGGYVYRGTQSPGLYGYYLFADNSSSRFWAMQAGSPWSVTSLNVSNVSHPSSFGEDINGELYVTALGTGRVYRLQGNVAPIIQTPVWIPLIRR